jgi:hypothetical protein
MLGPEKLAAKHEANRAIPADAIKTATLRKTGSRLFRELEITYQDGSTEVLKWQKGDNEDAYSIALLGRVLGDRFTKAF